MKFVVIELVLDQTVGSLFVGQRAIIIYIQLALCFLLQHNNKGDN